MNAKFTRHLNSDHIALLGKVRLTIEAIKFALKNQS